MLYLLDNRFDWFFCCRLVRSFELIIFYIVRYGSDEQFFDNVTGIDEAIFLDQLKPEKYEEMTERESEKLRASLRPRYNFFSRGY